MEKEQNTTSGQTGTYIGEFLAQDICAYCNVKWEEGMNTNDKQLKLVRKLQSLENGYSAFCWPGAFLPMDWLAYRGLIPQALGAYFLSGLYLFIASLVIYLITLMLGPIFVCINLPATAAVWLGIIVGFVIYLYAMGHFTIQTFHKHVWKVLSDRQLANRPNIECPQLEESLRKEGKPSVKRAILFRLTFMLITACVEGIFLTLKYNLF